MFNKLAIQSLVASSVLGFALMLSTGAAIAQVKCGTKDNPCPPTAECGVKGKPACGICHNIGGPDGKGANCDWDAASCTVIDRLDVSTNAELLFLFLKYSEAVGICDARTGCYSDNVYAGIFVPHSDNAIEAHRAHGDGEILVRWDKKSDTPSDVTPSSRVHEPQPHVAANVDCFAERVIFPLEDHGN